MSIFKHEIEEMLEDINDSLKLKTTINDSMVKSWHRALEKHKPQVVKNAKEELIDDWESNYFPKPKQFKAYLAKAYDREEEKRKKIYRDPDTLHEMNPRVRKLMEASQRNIDAITKDTPKIKCAKCDKWALRNLRANDYFEYSDHAIFDEYDGAYLCSEHTGEMINFLGESQRYA